MTAASEATPAAGPATGGQDVAATQQATTEQAVAAKGPKAAKSTPQAGILNRPPEHLLLIGLALNGSDPRSTVEKIRAVVQAELTSHLEATPPDRNTSAGDTGELGYTEHHDRAHLTITVGFSSTGYDKLGVAQPNRPADLVPIPWDKLGDIPSNAVSGDLVLQVCADSAYITEHVLRRLEHSLAGEIQVSWAHTGVQRYNSRPGRTARREGRAWIGFQDGTSNLRPGKSEEDYALTFVDPDDTAGYPKSQQPPGQANPYGQPTEPQFPPDLREPPGTEPAWTRNGTYLVARVSVTDLPTWDATTLAAQEQVIGRQKEDGISLDLAGQVGVDAETPPAFAQNPTDEHVALDAHIRKANPRTAQDLPRRIFRRGYPLYEGGGETGLRRGLIFLCFARTISTQFEFIFRAWLTNPDFPRPGAGADRLRAFDNQVLTGGYYFVPPLDKAHEPWSWHVPPAST
jgi:deferrochelatase/peroxidase EfeB